jgi:hypothetical protein
MNAARNVSIFVLCILMLVPFAYADDASIDLATGLDVVDNQSTEETPSAEMIRQHTVLWDTTHGAYIYYHPYGNWTTLVGMLADSGFTISVCSTGVHTVDLTEFDVIVIAVGSNWYSSYTQEEVDSLVSYYDQDNQRVLLTGDMNFCDNTYIANADNIPFSYNIFEWLAESGGILIMGENPNAPNSNINPVANAFNMTAGWAAINMADLYFTNFASHPIFDGIDTVYYRLAGEVVATAPAEPIAWTDGNQPTIAVLDEFTAVKDGQTGIVRASRLNISPNPFRHGAEIQGVRSGATVRIFDVSGRLVAEQQERTIGSGLKQGVYFVQVDEFQTEKIVKLK